MALGTQNVHVHNTERMGFNFKLTEKIVHLILFNQWKLR